MEIGNNLYLGDCEDILSKLPDNSVDLIFTSPPYADQRKKTYGGIHPDNYVEWFIKLFTKEGDTVLDPFMGSGTTNIVANRMRRNSIGIEILPEYYEMVKIQIQPGLINIDVSA